MAKKYVYLLLGISFIFIGCTRLPTNFEKKESYAYKNTEKSKIAVEASKLSQENLDKTGVYILKNGLDAFVARIALIEEAEISIDVQYYLYHDDLIGKLFTHYLIKAADRGVRIRILVDDMGMGDKKKDTYAAILDNYPNIEVRIFNPFSRSSGRIKQLVTSENPVTRRMHNKSFTVDNQVTILGGRNIGDEYFDADPLINFADVDILGVGKISNEVSESFDEYWNDKLSYPANIIIKKEITQKDIEEYKKKLDKFKEEEEGGIYHKALINSNLAKSIKANDVEYEWGKTKVLSDKPDKLSTSLSNEKYNLTPQLEPYFNNIKKELIIFSPYFVPGDAGTEYLIDLVKKGIKVKILTNSLSSNDVGIVHSGYMKYRKKLLRGGVELYEMNESLESKEGKKWLGSSKASLHAKSFILDREIIFIGSLNLDPRSIVHNTEIGVMVESIELGENMAKKFDQQILKVAFKLELVDNKIIWKGKKDGKEIIFNKEPYTSFWKRLGVGFMRILPIESQL